MAGGEDLYYRSIDDLNRLVREAAARLPRDIDLVVGIPRSGLLVANLLALHMHVPMATLAGFQRGEILDVGSRHARRPAAPRKVLVVDDSVSSGRQLRAARDALQGVGVPILYATAYCTPEALALVDFAFEVLPQPRAFEWNILNGEILKDACIDLDVLVDSDRGTDAAGWRGPQLHYPVGHVVSLHPETMRAAIKAVLHQHGIACRRLWLAPSADEGHGARHDHLARVFRESGAPLFITRDVDVARRIADATRRPAFGVRTMQMIYPGRKPGAVMTFAGRRPRDLNVPLTWFLRQAAADVAHRLVARRRRARRAAPQT